MNASFKEHLTLDKMACHVNLTAEHFCRLFKAETGKSPVAFLKLLRMNQATHLLATTCLSVKEIMPRVGFADESHFVRDFKALFGCTPSDYRRTTDHKFDPSQPDIKISQ